MHIWLFNEYYLTWKMLIRSNCIGKVQFDLTDEAYPTCYLLTLLGQWFLYDRDLRHKRVK